jgi:putative endonuclease
MPGRRSGGAAWRNLRALGRHGEKLAEIHLQRQGFRILARNLHLRHAELDLVALEGSTLCFVEVRLRSSDRFGSAAESVDWKKRRRLARAAAEVLATRPLPRHQAVRFDMVSVDASKSPPEVHLIRDAFRADE